MFCTDAKVYHVFGDYVRYKGGVKDLYIYILGNVEKFHRVFQKKNEVSYKEGVS
jgi:hypothetical protein